MRLPRTLTARPLVLTLALACALGLFAAAGRESGPRRAGARPRLARPSLTAGAAREAYGRVEMSFEENRGQTDSSVNFLARGSGYTLFLRPTEAVFSLRSSQTKVLRMQLVGADESARVEGVDELPGRANYFVGPDPRAWRTNVPAFARVKYKGVYPGTDLVYYGNQRRLEYDFHVAPGHDPRAPRLRFEGADRVEQEASGDLLLHLGDGRLRQPKPFVYQEVAGVRRAVEGGYVVEGDGLVSFRVGEYDPTLPLVIDPVLVYSTYLGGSDTEDGNDIKVDSSGSAYVCGETSSTNFPTANAIQATFGGATFEGGRDAFITKLNPAGTAFVYSTYLGGSGDDRCNKIAVDAGGNAYFAGETTSTNFPTANAFQATFGGGLSDAYVTKLNAAGSALVFSTFLGGSIFDSGNGIALDSSDNVYVTGRTTSSNFPTANPIQAAYSGGPGADAYVTKFNAAGSALVYSTYLGGNGGNGFEVGFSIAVDSAGSAYVAGQTSSTNFPTANAIQATFGGGFPDGDAFVTKLNAAGSALVFSTYLGGTDNDIAFEIALDSAGSAHVSGVTRSTNFPTANAMRATLSGPSDAFVTKLNPAGTAFAYSTYFGGSGDDSANGIAVDSAGNTYLAIGTSSTDFPTVNPTQAASGGGIDAAVTKLNAAGSALIYSTYLGGSGTDAGLSIALDAANSMYLVGRTTSTNFPTLGPVQAANGGGQDAFITKIAEDPPATPTPTPAPTPTPMPAPATVQFTSATFNVTEGCVPATLTVTLTGTPTGTVAVDYVVNEGTARQKTDYTYVAGTVLPQSNPAFESPTVVSGRLEFALGETEKEIVVLITEDGFAEGTENLTVTLSNPRGASLGAPANATLNINDNDAVNSQTNPIDDPATFVCQLYHDFLHRQPDAGGQAFWTNEITSCGANANCLAEKRHNVAAAFFLSIEFQHIGFFIYRAYEAGLDRRPQYEEFMRDLNAVGLGVEVGVGDWQQRLAAQRNAFLEALVESADFEALFPETMTAEQFADKLFQNVGVTPTAAERQAVVSAYGVGNTPGRAAALAAGVESGSVFNVLYNRGFVLIEYFGFLRRDPEDPPDANLDGYNFWLGKMNDNTTPGEDARQEQTAFARIKRAEMVRAFLVSIEYRQRFGP